MMLKFYQLILAGFLLIGKGYSQDIITGVLINDYIGKAGEMIEEQTDFTVWDTSAYTACRVTLIANKMPLREFLDSVYTARGYTWRIHGKIISITRPSQKIITLRGKVTNPQFEGLSFATVNIKGTSIATNCDEEGDFSLEYIKDSFTIVVSMAGYYNTEKQVHGERSVEIELKPVPLPPVSVAPSKKIRADTSLVREDTIIRKTWSAYEIGKAAFRGTTAQPIAEGLSAYTGPLLFNPSASPDLNQAAITIRNRITIYGNPDPLIVLDGLVYHGDLSNINVNDVSNISILKDAAATAQWGVNAGNGVIDITTKKGSFNLAPQTSFTSAFTIGTKPDLFYLPALSSRVYMETAEMLYKEGFYTAALQNAPWAIVPPSVEIYYMRDQGKISAAEAETRLDKLRNTDSRQQALKYLYRQRLHQQYHVDVRGGSSFQAYSFSVGYDANQANGVGNDDKRLTISLNNTVRLGRNAPEITVGVYFKQHWITNNGFDIRRLLFPGEPLADEQGHALPVTQDIRQGYKDELVASTPLFDWGLKPLDEIAVANNQSINRSLILTAGLKYDIKNKMELSLSARYEKDVNEQVNRHSIDSYFTRDLINQYTQIDATGRAWRPIPIGDIVDENLVNRNAQSINAQVKFNIIQTKSSAFTVNIGSVGRHLKLFNKRLRRYGVNESGLAANIDYATPFSLVHIPVITQTIPYINSTPGTSEHFYALYANGFYAWKHFVATYSIRKDESNIFGVCANQKGAPLMSAGISWDISREPFYRSRSFPELRLRFSMGYCGNIYSTFSALTGLQFVGINLYGVPYSTIINPPNPSLSPEQVRIINFGVDVSLFDKKLTGSVEYFEKEGTNLLGLAPVDPTTGVNIFQGNVAAMKGHGIESAIHSEIGSSFFQWRGDLLASYVRDKVTAYHLPPSANWYNCDTRYINPNVGKPPFAINSLAFLGLDSTNGDPIGILNNSESKDYNAILQSTDSDNLVYHGSATPTFYGSFRNTLTWKQWQLQFTITWKAGYSFRRNSIRYVDLFNGLSAGHPDIIRRWKTAGDERYTNIPSLQYPGDPLRDLFYNYSSALVEKGDHIRLQEIKLQYRLHDTASAKTNRFIVDVFINVTNLGLIWKKNKSGVDPDYINMPPAPMMISAGVKIDI